MQPNKTLERQGTYDRLSDDHLPPIGPIAIISTQIDPVFSDQLNYHMRNLRAQQVGDHPSLDALIGYARPEYRIRTDLSRFETGEGRAEILDTVRGHDVYIVTDVLNYGQFYQRFNQTVSKAPDEHFVDLTRIIQAARSTALRVNVIMPFLYEGRRYRRTSRESLDCAMMLRQLFSLNINNFITFDAHDSRVANAVPRCNFETFPTSYYLIDGLLNAYPDIVIDADNFMIVAPDEVSISRCIYYASTLKVTLGVFYRRRDFIRLQNNQTEQQVSKRFLGDNVEGKDVLIIDDAIHTGKTMLESAIELKQLGAKRVFCAVSFGLFSSGFEKFNQAHDSGIIDRVFATNLTYCTPVIRNAPWYYQVNMSRQIATVIDALNHNASLSKLLAPSGKIEARIAEHVAKQATRG